MACGPNGIIPSMRDADPRRTIPTSPRACALAALLAAHGCGDDGSSGDATSGASTSTTAGDATVDATTSVDSTATGSSGVDPSTITGDDTTTSGEPNELDDDAIARIREAVEQSLGNGLATGCSVAIWRDGEVIYAEGFGTKDEAGNPVTTDTLFQIGSDTKKLAAMTLLQLVDAGELSLDQTVGELLPALELAPSPGHLDALTVHQLLSHQSGLWDYTPWIDGPDDGELSAVAYGTFAMNEFAMMPAGIAWNYSNPNFSLTGLLVEELGGRSWPDVVIDDVAAPLGMTNTYARRDDVLANASDVASGFGPIYPDGIDSFDLLELASLVPLPPDWTLPEEQADHAFTRPAGLLWSTASDMARLGGFLIDGDPRVLSAASHAALVSAHVPLAPGVDPDELGYAYGLARSRGFEGPDGSFYDVTMLSHGGNTLSMTSTTMLLPDQSVAVSILANGANEDSVSIATVALAEAAALRLPAPSEPYSPIQPPSADLSVYAGSFTEPVLGDVTLALDGNDLVVDIPALTALGFTVDPVLLPVYRDVFVLTLDGAPLDISFYDGTLPYEHGVNRNFVLQRETGMAPPAPPVRRELVEAWVRRATGPSPLSLPRRP
jgi:CubicO group peptidase (beta-lactamase class C family)